MADQGKWFKLWVSALNDPDLDNLDISDFGRWAKLGAHIKEQGTDGEIVLSYPSRTLVAKMQISDFNAMIMCIQKLPNISVSSETNEPVSFKIKCDNWLKYQGDWSTNRVHKFREKNALLKRSKKRREEKRREEKRKEDNTTKKEYRDIPPKIKEVTEYYKQRNNQVDPHIWYDHYKAKGWMIGKNKMVDWRAAVHTWEKRSKQESRNEYI